jgi:hypothetical protein
MTRTLARRLAPLAAVAALGAALTAFAPAPSALFGPPWISIEYPPSPYDRVTREALLLVNAYHHATPVGLPVSGTAEGIVDGKRRTVRLQFQSTSRPGTYALRKQWPTEGAWVLNLAVTQGEGEYNTAGALVTLDREGKVAKVDVPLRQIAGFEVRTPRRITSAEVEAALQAQVRLAAR